MNDLYLNFQKYFEVVVVDTAELLENAYKLRYQVLCIEQRLPGFDASLYPDELEKDDYDNHSSHVLLRHIPSGNFIGTVRLIMPSPIQPEKLLPIELYGQLDPTLCDIKALPRHQAGEISRFVITAQFQRRRGDRNIDDKSDRRVENKENKESKESKEGNTDVRERRAAERRDRRSAPPLALLLAAGIVRVSAEQKINNWLSVMDPALNRLLGYYGLELNPIGPLVDYHGQRRSYFARIGNVLDRMYKDHHEAWEVVTDCGKYNQFVLTPP